MPRANSKKKKEKEFLEKRTERKSYNFLSLEEEGTNVRARENERRRIANARKWTTKDRKRAKNRSPEREREREKKTKRALRETKKKKKGSRVNDNCPRGSFSAIQKCNTLVRVCDFNTKNFRHIFYRACRFSLQRTGRGDDDDDVARKKRRGVSGTADVCSGVRDFLPRSRLRREHWGDSR